MNNPKNPKLGHNKKTFLEKPVEHIDITSFDSRKIIESMDKMSFTSRDTAKASNIFNEMLSDKNAKVETLEGLKKGREAMRMSLNISPKAKASEAVLKFWATGKMLKAAYKKNKKKKKKKAKQLTPEVAERAAVLANLKKQIATAKVNAQRAATIKAQEKVEEASK